MIIFVGDKPSAKNLDPKVPFVGTQSYKRLLEWIWKMDVNINEVKMVNKDDLFFDLKDKMQNVSFEKNSRVGYTLEGCRFIALGKNAANILDGIEITRYYEYGPHAKPEFMVRGSYKTKLPFFELPHPSGLNRKLNNKRWLNKQLKECKQWLNR